MIAQGQVLPVYVPTNGLQVWYPFAGNANDLSTNSLHATAFGVQSVDDRNGQTGQAYFFTGTITSYIIRTNPAQHLLDGGTGSFSLSLWFKTNSTGIRTMVNKRRLNGTANLEGYSLFLDNGKVKFHLSDANNINTLVNCTTAYNDNIWHHVLVTRDVATDKISVFVDNQLEMMMNDASGSSVSTTGDFYVGRWLNYDQYGFIGSLDEIGFWNRALTQLEISELYYGCTDSIVVQPLDQNSLHGTTAVFTTLSSDTFAEYQWQSNAGFGFMNLSDAGQYQGVTTSTLTISNIHQGNANQLFRCIVNGKRCVDTSQTAMLTLDVSGVSQPEHVVRISIAPNPTQNGYVILKADDLSQIKKAEVLSLHGKIIRSLEYEELSGGIIPISSHAGVYLIRLHLTNGEMLTQRVVVL